MVRHGQASFASDDYDVLSPLGIQQTRALGAWWAQSGGRLDAVYTGPRQRHRDSAQNFAKAAIEGGMECPDPALAEGLDEIDVGKLMEEAMTRVLPSCPDLREQLSGDALNDDGEAAMTHYKGVFKKLMQRWARGDGAFETIEPFAEFTARVQSALHGVMRKEGRGRRVLLMTSGGPIAVALRLALGLSAEKTIDMLWPTHNASVTRLDFSKSELTLSGYNAVHHLDADLLTYV